MRRFCIALGALALGVAAQANEPTIEWRTDLAKARAQARATGRPLAIVFR